MSNSKPSLPAAVHQSTDKPAFHVVLRDVYGTDYRKFKLSLASEFPIGRASTTNEDLMPAANNAYIESRVISRKHAVFTMNANRRVYITDKKSMHGTFLNDEKLENEVPALLTPGDELRFGVDIKLGESTPPRPLFSNNAKISFPPEFFVAREYYFNPPHRQTEVSIGEIVEEQPLTPTSDKEMKRKADVLDEPNLATLEPAQDVHAELAAVPELVEDNTAQTAAIIAQRPKKEPHSILARVWTPAKYLGVGAAGAVSVVVLLSSRPDFFFA